MFYLFYVAYLFNFCNNFGLYIVKCPTIGWGISRKTSEKALNSYFSSRAEFLAGSTVRSGGSE